MNQRFLEEIDISILPTYRDVRDKSGEKKTASEKDVAIRVAKNYDCLE